MIKVSVVIPFAQVPLISEVVDLGTPSGGNRHKCLGGFSEIVSVFEVTRCERVSFPAPSRKHLEVKR